MSCVCVCVGEGVCVLLTVYTAVYWHSIKTLLLFCYEVNTTPNPEAGPGQTGGGPSS